MRISIVTLFPKMIEGFFAESIIKRAQEKGVINIELINLREFAVDRYGSVDDKPYGGGAGMVMRVDVLHSALEKIKTKNSHTILTSPKGTPFNQQKAKEFSKLDHLVLIAGHYEGVDERILKDVNEEISLGDFVMTGGEIAVAAIVDSVARLIPGVLKKEDATTNDSFFTTTIKHLIEVVGKNEILIGLQNKGAKEVTLLEYPHYTRPEEFQGKKVPEVLLSGNHAEIDDWRIKTAFEETLKKRPDLLK